MDKSFLVFMAIGLGALYLVINFIGDIQEEDDKYQNEGYQQEHKYDAYQMVDSIGQEVLDVTGADVTTQVNAWNQSMLKQDFLALFPDFSEMQVFITERIRGDKLKSKLSTLVEDIEGDFFGGGISPEQAKRKLGSLK